jgi:hypothetical protein
MEIKLIVFFEILMHFANVGSQVLLFVETIMHFVVNIKWTNLLKFICIL